MFNVYDWFTSSTAWLENAMGFWWVVCWEIMLDLLWGLLHSSLFAVLTDISISTLLLSPVIDWCFVCSYCIEFSYSFEHIFASIILGMCLNFSRRENARMFIFWLIFLSMTVLPGFGGLQCRSRGCIFCGRLNNWVDFSCVSVYLFYICMLVHYF